jgi:hypothetical protein
VRDILFQSARDVTTGTNNTGQTAGPGHDLATGPGLVDAHKAVLLAKLRCLRRPIRPDVIGPNIIQPIPIRPDIIGPNIGPVIQPNVPIRPDIVTPIPIGPAPIAPNIGPVINPGPGPRRLGDDVGTAEPTAERPGLSDDDLDALEAMILEDGGDLDL